MAFVAYILRGLSLLSIPITAVLSAETPDAELLVAYHNVGRYTEPEILASFGFLDGRLCELDTLIEFDAYSGINLHSGRNTIADRRYVATSGAHILDLDSGAVLFARSGRFVGARGDSLIYRRKGYGHADAYFIFDTRSGEYVGDTDSLFTALPGIESPDLRFGLATEYLGWTFNEELVYSLFLYVAADEKRMLVVDAGVGTNLSRNSVESPRLPMLWVDDNTIVYAKFENGIDAAQIITVDTAANITPIATIRNLPPSTTNAFFYRNPDGDMIFVCGVGEYLIDMQHGRASRKRRSLGNGFTIESARGDGAIRNIRYNNRRIGAYRCGAAYAAEGYVAVEVLAANTTGSRNVANIMIWSAASHAWQTLAAPAQSTIIGWRPR